MNRMNLAYRHQNGDVEGFSALRFGRAAAEEACYRLIKEKCLALDQSYDPTRVINTHKGLKSDEMKTIQEHWALVRNPGDPNPNSGMIGFLG